MVVIGNGGAEYGVRGYITAYDAETGKQAWRFYTVPGDPGARIRDPTAMDSRCQDLERRRGGRPAAAARRGTGMVYDPDLDLLYFGTGNASTWYRAHARRGRQFVRGLVSWRCNASTGELVWHFQTTPGDSWDYDATQPLDPGRS